MNFLNIEFELEVVVAKLGQLDLAVLRLVERPDRDVKRLHLPPVNSLTVTKVGGANVRLVHGNIAWTSRTNAIHGQSRGSIVAIDATRLLYDIATMRGHSGAVLLIRGKDLIGFHCEGLGQKYSTRQADAVRLDLQCVHDAVQQAMR